MQGSIIRITDQCCDADSYIQIGYRCAMHEACFDILRPVGSAYWFSIPFRFNAGLELIFWMQLLIFLGVVALSWLVFRVWCHFWQGPAQRMGFMHYATWLALIGFWIFCLWPTFFHTLSDTPASLLLVAGVLLLLLAMLRDNPACYFLGGIFLGLVAIIRTAYFNPLVLGMVLFLLLSIWQFFRVRNVRGHGSFVHWKSLLVFSCVFPFSLQYIANWKNADNFSFVSSEYSDIAMNLHLESVGAGYDTLLPQNGYYWSPVCDNARGLKWDFNDGNFSGIVCLLIDKTRFYLGSYAPGTYLGAKDRDFLDYGFAEQVGVENGWGSHQLRIELSSAVSPLGELTASRLVPEAMENGDGNYYVQEYTIMPLYPGRYEISVWLRSDESAMPSLRVFNRALVAGGEVNETQDMLVLDKSLSLDGRFQKVSFVIEKETIGYLVARLGYFDLEPGIKPEPFYAWGMKLEPADSAIGYTRYQVTSMGLVGLPDNVASERIFSLSLLFMNLAVIAMALIGLWHCWKQTEAPIVVFLGASLLGIYAQCLLVVPEQRFVQGAMMVSWLLCLLWVSSRSPLAWPEGLRAVKS